MKIAPIIQAKYSKGVIADSGGIWEETTYLRIPVYLYLYRYVILLRDRKQL